MGLSGMTKKEFRSQLYEMVGFVCVHWAMVEEALDLCVAMTFNGLGGKGLIRDDIPVSFELKIAYLKKAYRQLPAVADINEDAQLIFTDAKVFAQTRHDLVHGAMMYESGTGQFETWRTLYEPQIHSTKKVRIDLKTFPETSMQLALLEAQTSWLTRSTHRILTTKLGKQLPWRHPA